MCAISTGIVPELNTEPLRGLLSVHSNESGSLFHSIASLVAKQAKSAVHRITVICLINKTIIMQLLTIQNNYARAACMHACRARVDNMRGRESYSLYCNNIV